MTDNGACYRSAAFGVAGHRRHRPPTDPAVPALHQRQGRALQPDLNREWAYAAAHTSNHDRLAALPGWLHAYNYHCPHSALSGRSPISALNNLPGNHT
jgi:transposase InsO family protein